MAVVFFYVCHGVQSSEWCKHSGLSECSTLQMVAMPTPVSFTVPAADRAVSGKHSLSVPRQLDIFGYDG